MFLTSDLSGRRKLCFRLRKRGRSLDTSRNIVGVVRNPVREFWCVSSLPRSGPIAAIVPTELGRGFPPVLEPLHTIRQHFKVAGNATKSDHHAGFVPLFDFPVDVSARKYKKD